MHSAFIDSLDELTNEQLDRPVDMTCPSLEIWDARDLYHLHGSVEEFGK